MSNRLQRRFDDSEFWTIRVCFQLLNRLWITDESPTWIALESLTLTVTIRIQQRFRWEIQVGIQWTKHHLNRPFFWIVGAPPESLQLFESRFTWRRFNSPHKYADQIMLHNLNDSYQFVTVRVHSRFNNDPRCESSHESSLESTPGSSCLTATITFCYLTTLFSTIHAWSRSVVLFCHVDYK